VPAAATVEGILIHQVPTAFAGCRRNVGLGRSDSVVWGSFSRKRSHRRQEDVLWKNEEGNVVSVRQAHALFAVTPNKRGHERGHVLRSVQRPVHVNRHSLHEESVKAPKSEGVAAVEISRSGKPGQPGGTGTGVLIDRTNARLAARHRFSGNREGPA